MKKLQAGVDFFHSYLSQPGEITLYNNIQRLGMTLKARGSLCLAIFTCTCTPRISRTSCTEN